MAEPVRARRLSDLEGGSGCCRSCVVERGSSIRVRRATIIMASASGTPVAAIARLVAADEDTVRDVIHAFNERGLAALDPQWAGGRPRQISDDDIAFIVTTATTRPDALGRPVHAVERAQTRRPPAPHGHDRRVRVGRERLRLILREHHGISFQRTRTWKESTDPDKDAKLDRIEYVTSHFPNRVLRVRPVRAAVDPALPRRPPGRAAVQPARLPATYHRTHGIRYFHGCYSLGDDQLWGVNRRRKGGDHTLAALKSIRAARPDGAPIYVIMDNLSANKTPAIRGWAARERRAVLHPDLARPG